MSITALILIQTFERRDELAAKHGRAAVEKALFITAARIIAGDYEHAD